MGVDIYAYTVRCFVSVEGLGSPMSVRYPDTVCIGWQRGAWG